MNQTNPEPRAPSRKLTRITAAILTVVFLGFVFAAFSAMVTQNWRGLNNAVRRMTSLQAYLPERWDRLDLLQARISSFTAYISEIMWHKDALGYVNSDFQYALGKRVINTGSRLTLLNE